MTYGRSSLIERLLIEAYSPKKSFSIIVVDNPPYNEGKGLVEKLAENDIKATYTLLNGAPYFMKRVTKVDMTTKIPRLFIIRCLLDVRPC